MVVVVSLATTFPGSWPLLLLLLLQRGCTMLTLAHWHVIPITIQRTIHNHSGFLSLSGERARRQGPLRAFSVRHLSRGRESRRLLLPCYAQREARMATVVAVAVAPG